MLPSAEVAKAAKLARGFVASTAGPIDSAIFWRLAAGGSNRSCTFMFATADGLRAAAATLRCSPSELSSSLECPELTLYLRSDDEPGSGHNMSPAPGPGGSRNNGGGAGGNAGIGLNAGGCIILAGNGGKEEKGGVAMGIGPTNGAIFGLVLFLLSNLDKPLCVVKESMGGNCKCVLGGEEEPDDSDDAEKFIIMGGGIIIGMDPERRGDVDDEDEDDLEAEADSPAPFSWSRTATLKLLPSCTGERA